MLLKISGCLLVIAATTLTGITRADKIQEQYRQMRVLQRLLYMLESEIRYAHTHLGEIFLRVSRRVKEPYRDWLLSMEKRMGQTDSGTFETIWRQAVTVNLSSSGLPAREVDRLSQLGAQQISSLVKIFRAKILPQLRISLAARLGNLPAQNVGIQA